MGGESSKPAQDPDISRENYQTQLFDVQTVEGQLPLVYSDEYNITFGGLQKLHPFDSEKWGKIVRYLESAGMVKLENLIAPNEATRSDLLMVHTEKYLNSLKSSWTVAMVTEVVPVGFVPNTIVQRVLLRRLRLQTGGTILGAKLALENGWCINIGGGFHHCSAESGGGFCAYADISLAIKFLFKHYPDEVKKAMIIDLDAHQGNGHERDFIDDERVYILDAYNHSIYPGDTAAKRGIRKDIRLAFYTNDATYLPLIQRNICEALDDFRPDFILYNAGTDILDGDPLGLLNISSKGITQRDEIVFEKARKLHIPILMVTSGGYRRCTARVIADSILNLKEKGLLEIKRPESKYVRQEAERR